VQTEGIWIVDFFGEGRKIADGGWPVLAGDGKSLHFHSRQQMKILRLNVDSPAEAVTVCKMPYSYYPPITADGKCTAYLHQDELVVLDTVSGKPLMKRMLTGWSGLLAGWSPDGKLLGFGSYGGDSAVGLWILNVQTGRVIQVAEGWALHRAGLVARRFEVGV
jgi:hypothetical protein